MTLPTENGRKRWPSTHTSYEEMPFPKVSRSGLGRLFGTRPTRESGLHPRTSELTSDFREVRGFRLPGAYGDGMVEYWACREGLAIADLSVGRESVTSTDDQATIVL